MLHAPLNVLCGVLDLRTPVLRRRVIRKSTRLNHVNERTPLAVIAIALGALLAATILSLLMVNDVSERLRELTSQGQIGQQRTLGLSQQPAIEGGSTLRVINVRGVGVVKATPDRLVVSMAVESRGQTATEAASKNDDLMNMVTSSLFNLGIPRESLRTTSISLQPIYVYDKSGEPTLVGYMAINSIEVTLTGELTNKAAEVIDEAIRAGANRINGIWFSISEEQIRQLKYEALKRAVEDARSKANEVANALGLTLVGVYSIDVVSEDFPPGPAIYVAGTPSPEAGARTSTPIFPGELTYTVTINVVIGIS